MRIIWFILLSGFTSIIMAEPAKRLEIQKVTNGVYALVGQRGPMSKWNFGTNATFGAIITGKGVVLIDPGASYRAAKYIHEAIKTITDSPIVLVINTGGEDQRWLGNSYFKMLGAHIIASSAAIKYQRENANDQLIRLDGLITEGLAKGTTSVYADESFEKEKILTVGGVEIVLKHDGIAYTAGDTYVWLPEKKVLFSGDIISVERMLAIAINSKTKSWIKIFKNMEKLEPEYIIPGHGHVTNIKKARADTLDYLVLLRQAVKEFITKGGEIEDVSTLNQYPLSPFERLIGYDMLMGRNALHVYMDLEWEMPEH